MKQIETDRLYLSSEPYIMVDEDINKWQTHLYYQDYLYRSISGKIPFPIYEEELKRLNNYIVYLLEKTNEETEEQINAHANMEPDWIGVGTAEIEMTQELVKSTCSFNRNNTLYLTAVTLLNSFLESCLKDLVKRFISEEKIRSKGMSNVEKYVFLLNEFLKSEISMPEYLKKSRKLRNEFVHNHLSSFEVGEEVVRYTIDAIADLFYVIEQEFSNKGILDS
ncbi:hypothetical protein LG489_000831 [Listeria monocytogenes]|uniref:hypothetical protein n=1 Tax=Listeria monocytogenes TaxID=1639 RepID=UPI0010B730C5|nr:hypothetical protein [Listeria monocytogenes]EAC4735243.1 hypothetical protein [Listeria monocytogenes]EAD6991536.1 hypothetical protein [Listeria monocytogenes]EAD8562220.1 hypothetical protein [Listeria monocytogenes]EAG1709584.1 hypothetical protein [Listeria monocytogenes]EAV9836014.1 hypothetical protein [Listeria monocytogenes]